MNNYFYKRKITVFSAESKTVRQNKTQRFNKCFSRKQSLRIPKEKGLILIHCPKYHASFEKEPAGGAANTKFNCGYNEAAMEAAHSNAITAVLRCKLTIRRKNENDPRIERNIFVNNSACRDYHRRMRVYSADE